MDSREFSSMGSFLGVVFEFLLLICLKKFDLFKADCSSMLLILIFDGQIYELSCDTRCPF